MQKSHKEEIAKVKKHGYFCKISRSRRKHHTTDNQKRMERKHRSYCNGEQMARWI